MGFLANELVSQRYESLILNNFGMRNADFGLSFDENVWVTHELRITKSLIKKKKKKKYFQGQSPLETQKAAHC